MKRTANSILLFLLMYATAAIAQNDFVASDTIYYEIDTVKSYLAWSCDSHNGIVPLKSGEVKVVDNMIVAGNFVVKMDSLKDLDIDYTLMRETLHNTLKSNFFFDVANYPTADFTLDYVEPLGKSRYAVSGDLKIKGIVNCIHFKSKITFDKKIFSATTDTFDVDRTQYGITIYSPGEAVDDNSVVVSDEIHFVVHLTGAPTQ